MLRFIEVVEVGPDQEIYGVPSVKRTIGMINLDVVISFKVPPWSTAQGPTQFMGADGKTGWAKESYLNLFTMLGYPDTIMGEANLGRAGQKMLS